MENQIQLYHDATAFWLDKEWKTPREEELEREVAQLKRERSNLEVQLKQKISSLETQNKGLEQKLESYTGFIGSLKWDKNALEAQNEALEKSLESLSQFKDIPCQYCGKPLKLTRKQVLEAFKNWAHIHCIKREQEPKLVIIKQE